MIHVLGSLDRLLVLCLLELLLRHGAKHLSLLVPLSHVGVNGGPCQSRKTSISLVPPVKRDTNDEMFDGALEATPSASIPSDVMLTSGMTAFAGAG